MKMWNLLPLEDKKVKENIEKYNMPYFTAALFAARGINPDEFECENFSDPFEIKDMDKAVKRINLALENKEKIYIYGDYDADGITSVSILYLYLKRKGADVEYFIPDRKIEGYGINCEAVKQFAKKDTNLLIAVDNGIACFDEVLFAKGLGIDTVIVDHHRQQGDTVPEAIAVVDPHRQDCQSVFKEYCAAGLAFKLLSALEPDESLEFFEEYLNLAAIGTIGDAVPLTGENRKIVKLGIKNLKNTPNMGLNRLVNTSKINNHEVNFKSILFGVVPKINAAGRISHGKKVVMLFTCENKDRVNTLNEQIIDYNDTRKYVQENILKQAVALINENPEILNNAIITIYGKNWNQGVIGIVAAKISEKYGKPCIVISTERNETRGSGRSIEGFSLYQAVYSCRDCLTKYGGHHMAVGFSIEPERIGEFIAKLNNYTKNLPPEVTLDKLKIDLSLNLDDLDDTILDQLDAMRPFGKAFFEPLILIKNAIIKSVYKLKEGKYIKLNIVQNGEEAQVICFFYSYYNFPFRPNDKIDLVVDLAKNEYNGQTVLSLILKDIRLSGVDYQDIFEDYKKINMLSSYNQDLKIEGNMLPKREDFALVYNFIKMRKKVLCDVLNMYYLLHDKISYFKLETIINVFLECNILLKTNDFRNQMMYINNSIKKADIFNSELYLKLEQSAKINTMEN